MAITVALGIGLALIGLAATLPAALGVIGVMGVLIGFAIAGTARASRPMVWPEADSEF